MANKNRYDFSLNIVGQLSNLKDIQDQLDKNPVNINFNIPSSVNKMIADLQKLVDGLNVSLNGLSNINVGGSKGNPSASTSPAITTDLENARRIKSQQTLISQVQSKLNMGDRSGLFGVNTKDFQGSAISGSDIKSGYEKILADAHALDISTDSYKKKLVEAQTELAKLNPQYQALQKESQKTLDKTDSFLNIFMKKISNALAYRLIFTVFNTIQKGMSSLINTTIDINSEVRDINKVLDVSASQMDNLVSKANDLAIAYARTTLEVLKGMEYFAKAGYGISFVTQLSEISLLLQNVGDMSADTASKLLITVDASFQLNSSLEELSKTIDMMNAVSNNNAYSISEMSAAISTGASVAFAAGMNLNEYISAIATIGTATQKSGREVGNGLKTILLRLTQVNDTSNDAAESISNTDKVLQEVGINVRATANSFKAPTQILSELAERWEHLSDVQQRAITYNLAGVYRSNILESFLANIDEYEKNLYITLNSVGSATKENELYMNSLEAGIKKVTAAWESFVVKAKASKAISAVLSGFAFLMKNIDIILTGIFVATLPNLISLIGLLFVKIGTLAKSMFNAKVAVNALATSTQTLGATMKSAFAIISLIVVAYMALANAQKKARQSQIDNIRNSVEETNRLLGQYGQLNILIRQYQQLYNQYKKTGEGVEELRDLQSELNSQYGIQARGIDLVNGNLDEQIKKLDELRKAKAQEVYESGKAGALLAENDLTERVKGSGFTKLTRNLVGRFTNTNAPGGRGESEYQRYSMKDLNDKLGLGAEFKTKKGTETRSDSTTYDWTISREGLLKYLDYVKQGLTEDLEQEGLTEKDKNYLLKRLNDADEAYKSLHDEIKSSLESRDKQIQALKDLATTSISDTLVNLQGSEKGIYDLLTGNIEIKDVSQKGLDNYQNKIKSIAETLDGIDANNFETKWQALLGVFPELTEKDKENALKHLTNLETRLSDSISAVKEKLSPFEQEVKKLEDKADAIKGLYDFRRSIADEAGLQGDDYKSFASDGNTGLITDPKLKDLAQRMQQDYDKYLEDINNAEAQGLNNQDAITKLYETQVKLKQKELEILKKQLAIDEKRKNLNALENERTQVSFINGQKVWVQDYEAVEKARQELENAQNEKTKLESELSTDRDIATRQEEYTKLSTSMEELNLAMEKGDSALKVFGENLDKVSSILTGDTGLGQELQNMLNIVREAYTFTPAGGNIGNTPIQQPLAETIVDALKGMNNIRIDKLDIYNPLDLQAITKELDKKRHRVDTPW